jgi:drug/metabolite transporter (DMT)-like permease
MQVDTRITQSLNALQRVLAAARKWFLMAHEPGNSDETQLTVEFPAEMLGSHRSIATLAPGVSENRPLCLRTRTVIVLLVVSNVLGSFTLSRGLHEVGRLVSFSPWPYIHAFLNPSVGVGVLLLIVWLISQLSLLSRVDLSYALPATSVSYVLTAFMAEFLLHERLSIERWIGIGLIGVGVSLVARTVPRTAPVLHKLGDLPCEAGQ